MKKAVSVYDDLKDTFEYLASDWLRAELTETTLHDSYVIVGAAAFLLDNLYYKEDAGADITRRVAVDMEKDFSAQRLANMATKIRLMMSGDDFSLGSSPLRDYIKWVSETKGMVTDCYKGNEGKLAVAVAEELTNLVVAENKEQIPPMRVAELTFLNITDQFRRIYLDFFKAKYKLLPSVLYFDDVAEEMEDIRARIDE